MDLILTNRQKCFQNSAIIKAGLPDFFKLSFAVSKSYFRKPEPNKLTYRDFKNFFNQKFRAELLKELSEYNIDASQFELFRTISLGLLIKLAPAKQNTLKNNQSSFITKEMRKAIMTHSTLRNKILKTKFQECKQTLSKQRNLGIAMVRKEKTNYFNNLNEKNIRDNKQFWKTVKPFPTRK